MVNNYCPWVYSDRVVVFWDMPNKNNIWFDWFDLLLCRPLRFHYNSRWSKLVCGKCWLAMFNNIFSTKKLSISLIYYDTSHYVIGNIISIPTNAIWAWKKSLGESLWQAEKSWQNIGLGKIVYDSYYFMCHFSDRLIWPIFCGIGFSYLT